jgi:nucleoside-diphosphate-sugar epimerase
MDCRVATSRSSPTRSAPICAPPRPVHNARGASAYTLLDILQILEETLGVRVAPEHTAPRTGDVRHSLADLTAVKDELGYEPAVALPLGLRLTVESFTKGMTMLEEEVVSD